MAKKTFKNINDYGQVVLLLGATSALLYVLYLLDHLFNPLGYALAIAIILYPLRRQPVARALLYATAYIVGFWFLYDSGHLLIPFVVAYLISFLVNPIVVFLERKGVARSISATLTTFLALIGVGMLLFFGIPFLTQQLSNLARLFSRSQENAGTWIDETGILDLASQMGLDTASLRLKLLSHIDLVVTNFYQGISQLNPTYVSSVGNLLTALFFLILLPFLLFFMVRDYSRIGAFLRLNLAPKKVSVDYVSKIGSIVGSYLRGQFFVVLISMVNLSIGFYFVGLPYAVLLGVFAGLTNFIPTFGLWLSLFVTSIAGITLGEPWYSFLPGIYLVFGIEQVLETGFIVPRVIGREVGLHPIVVMISLLLFGFMFGFLGLLIAVPTVALISAFWQDYRETGQLPFLSGAEIPITPKRTQEPPSDKTVQNSGTSNSAAKSKQSLAPD